MAPAATSAVVLSSTAVVVALSAVVGPWSSLWHDVPREEAVRRLRTSLMNIPFTASIVLSVVGYVATSLIIPRFLQKFVDAML